MPSSSSNRVRFGLVLVTVIALAFWQSAHAQVVAFGAGNISGWNVAATQVMPAQLQSMLNANGYAVRVLNAGIHDNTTTDMRNRLDQDVPPGTKIVILDMTGGIYNDPIKGISPQQGKANLQAITAGLRARGITVIAVNFGDFPTAPRQPDGRHLTAEGDKYVAA